MPFLVPDTLDRMKEAGVDAFWLDIKAFDEKTHIGLMGRTNWRASRKP
jgi:pyruvate-formate lyase-activating enzyme